MLPSGPLGASSFGADAQVMLQTCPRKHVSGRGARVYQEYPRLENVELDRRGLLSRAWLNLNDLTVNPDTHLYFYTALDLRFYIESLFLELLSAIKGETLTSRERTIYRAKDFAGLLAAMDEPIDVLAVSAFGAPLSDTEVQELVVAYGKLGAFLHLPKAPYFSSDQCAWKETAEAFIGSTYQFLESLEVRLKVKHR
jgi:hypothetical protein